jgi:hypothetical protein
MRAENQRVAGNRVDPGEHRHHPRVGLETLLARHPDRHRTHEAGSALRAGPSERALFLFGGVWLLLNDLQVLRYRGSWPLLLVGFGSKIAWDALAGPAPKVE